jgi:hypothetical protein
MAKFERKIMAKFERKIMAKFEGKIMAKFEGKSCPCLMEKSWPSQKYLPPESPLILPGTPITVFTHFLKLSSLITCSTLATFAL